jgi:hypothetical protein
MRFRLYWLPMAKPSRRKVDEKQINPKITAELDERLVELMGVYRAEKYLVVNVALEYGASHFKKAWAEYNNDDRRADFRDADDVGPDPRVSKLPPHGRSSS